MDRSVSTSTPFREGMFRMGNDTAVAKAVVTAACTLAIGLLIIGMGANSSWAGSDQSTPISSEGVFQPAPSPPAPVDHKATAGGSHVHPDRIVDQDYASKSPLLLAQECLPAGSSCDISNPRQCCNHNCGRDTAGNYVCFCLSAGNECQHDVDCCSTSGCNRQSGVCN